MARTKAQKLAQQKYYLNNRAKLNSYHLEYYHDHKKEINWNRKKKYHEAKKAYIIAK